MKLCKQLLSSLCLASTLLVVLSVNQAVYAADAPTPTPDKPVPNSGLLNLTPTPPTVNAKAYLLVDADSGKVLAEKNADQQVEPASLTKLMTLYVTSTALQSGRIHLTDKVRISKDAWHAGGSRMFVKVNSYVPVLDLIKGIIVDSGNDACVALSEYVAGSEKSFVSLMNQQAKILGMNHSHFVDSTGLPDPKHYSTAHDLMTLTRAIIKDFPEDYQWYRQKWFKWNNIRQPNRNRLLWWDPSVDGLKTGHTKEAGFCLISSAKRQDMRLVSVVLGAPTDNDRASDSQKLLNYGFHFYETHQLFKAHTPLTQPRVYKGVNKAIALGIADDLFVTIPTGQYKYLHALVKLDHELVAPIAAGKTYGHVLVTLNGKTVKQVPLIALQSDAKGGLWRRMSDSIALTWHHWFHKSDKS